MPIVRHSRKRDAILDRLRSTNCHPTADWVHRQVREDFPDISLGTVYRNLNQLCDEGLAIRVGMVKGQERFDGCTDPHTHFVCERCGGVTDLPERPTARSYITGLSQQYGFAVNYCEFKLRGICKTCKENIKQEEN